MSEPVTKGRTFGLGRSLPNPREHCKRCADITTRADQLIMNYIVANGNQVQIINRLLKNPDAAEEIIHLGERLSEVEAFIDYIDKNVAVYTPDAIRERIAEFQKEREGSATTDTTDTAS